MISEEHCIGGEENAVVKRTLVDDVAEYIHIMFTDEHGIIKPSVVTLKHKEMACEKTRSDGMPLLFLSKDFLTG